MTPASRHRPPGRRAGAALLALALLLGVIVGGRAITDEGAFFLAGDVPRYLMNGVFLHDWFRSASGWHPADTLTYAERYYARYPALSLGHHMPLLPLVLVPFYSVFGVSIFSARLAILASFLLAIVLLYRLVARRYDGVVGGWACVLFVTSPIVGSFGQRVLSEMPTIALTLAALNLIDRFHRSGRLRDYLWVIAVAAASLSARPTAAYMFPYYGVLLATGAARSHLRQRKILIASVGAAAVATAAVVTMVAFAPFNAAVVGRVLGAGVDLPAVAAVLRRAMRERPLFMAAVCGYAAAVIRRDRRILPVSAWIVSVLGCTVLLTGSIEPGRYSILAVPAYCIVAASLSAQVKGRLRYLATAALLTAAGWQLSASLSRPTLEAPGYEAAAAYVVGLGAAPTVLYSASIDTGYFVFFVRKHDAAGRLVILRSDKLLTTSEMGQLSIEDRIQARSQIDPILHRYGTRYIVIEDRPSGTVALEWLRDLLRSDRFIERARFPIGAGAPELIGVSLVVYEFLDRTDPEPGAALDLDLPLAGRRIAVSLSDLVAPSADSIGAAGEPVRR